MSSRWRRRSRPPPLLVDGERDPAGSEPHRVAGQGVAGAELDPAVADEAEFAGGRGPASEREHPGQLPLRVAHKRLVPQQQAGHAGQPQEVEQQVVTEVAGAQA